MGYKWAKRIMKKVTLIAMALLCSVAFTNCAAKKPVKQKVDPQQAYIDSLKRVQEIKRIEREMAEEEERAKLEHEAKMAQLRADKEIADLKAQNARKATEMRLEQKLNMPCIDQSYDKHGEYMAGYGVAENQIDRKDALNAANREAITDISTRYIGMISNAVSNYAKDVNTRAREQVKESELEGEATAIGKMAIEKYAEAVCRDFGKADDGTYTGYAAVHVPVGKVLDEIAQNMQVLQVDADRARFRDFVEKELNKQAAEKEAEQKALEELRQQVAQ